MYASENNYQQYYLRSWKMICIHCEKHLLDYIIKMSLQEISH